MHIPVPGPQSVPTEGTARVGVIRHLSAALREFGVELSDARDAAGLRADILDDRNRLISYVDLARLLLACEQQTRCDHIGLQIMRNARLADLGLAGRIARCGRTVGEGLQQFVDIFNLSNTAANVSVITSSAYTRFVYAIHQHGMGDTRQFQLGAMAIAFNVLQDLCGDGWLPTVVTIASRAPSDLRPCYRHFRTPLRFDSDESAVIFEQHWLDHPLPLLDPRVRQQVEAEARARRKAILADFPATVRRILRRQLIPGECSMDFVAALLGMHRRTLDRRLQEHGVQYGMLLESVKEDVARQLLLDTNLQVQQVAESLHFSSAANFATAFRRWTGMTPSAFRRDALPNRRAG